MEITQHYITVRELFTGYQNIDNDGVYGYGGKLNIRPKYQREFIYKADKRDAVIDTVIKGFPINIMYWAENEDGSYEVLDGQQRTISICDFVDNNYSINEKSFSSLPNDIKDKILDYKLFVYFCKGTDSEKLEWFKTINIAGLKLNNQELRNAVYYGQWLTSAKESFSRISGSGIRYGNSDGFNLLNGVVERQMVLERVLSWVSHSLYPNVTDKNVRICKYMDKYKAEKNAEKLTKYFTQVIDWVKLNFKNYNSIMKDVEWGILYNKYKNNDYSPLELADEIKELLSSKDVINKIGVYEYVLSKDKNLLEKRAFSKKIKLEIFEKQRSGVTTAYCNDCREDFELKDLHADHIVPYSLNGKTDIDNCQLLCRDCNLHKSNIT